MRHVVSLWRRHVALRHCVASSRLPVVTSALRRWVGLDMLLGWEMLSSSAAGVWAWHVTDEFCISASLSPSVMNAEEGEKQTHEDVKLNSWVHRRKLGDIILHSLG